MSNAKKTSIPVIVEGTEFESISAASRFLKVSSTSVWHACHTSGKLSGLSVSFKDKSMSKAKSLEDGYQARYYAKKKKEINNKKSCPVICETLNKKFKSIKDAAKFANANGWTMGIKMEVNGQFVDKSGNIYKRLKPMNTKNSYKSSSDTLTKEVHKHKKEDKKVINNDSIFALQTDAMSFIKMGDYKKATKFLEALKMITEK